MKRTGLPLSGTPFKLLAEAVISTLSSPVPNSRARTFRAAFPEASVVSTLVRPDGLTYRFASSRRTSVVSGKEAVGGKSRETA